METMCYVAQCKCGCGALIFASVDAPGREKDNAKKVASLIRDGFKVERMTVESVRSSKFMCHKSNAKLCGGA